VDEVRDLYDAEKQLVKALPKMAKASSSGDLRKAIEKHFVETENQVARLEKIFGLLEEKPRGKHCAGIAGIIEEGSDLLKEDASDAVARRLHRGSPAGEHYEMADTEPRRGPMGWASTTWPNCCGRRSKKRRPPTRS
jgi:ferritin-like metal-binding protein YciE